MTESHQFLSGERILVGTPPPRFQNMQRLLNSMLAASLLGPETPDDFFGGVEQRASRSAEQQQHGYMTSDKHFLHARPELILERLIRRGLLHVIHNQHLDHGLLGL